MVPCFPRAIDVLARFLYDCIKYVLCEHGVTYSLGIHSMQPNSLNLLEFSVYLSLV